jgi:hypothetical protein
MTEVPYPNLALLAQTMQTMGFPIDEVHDIFCQIQDIKGFQKSMFSLKP